MYFENVANSAPPALILASTSLSLCLPSLEALHAGKRKKRECRIMMSAKLSRLDLISSLHPRWACDLIDPTMRQLSILETGQPWNKRRNQLTATPRWRIGWYAKRGLAEREVDLPTGGPWLSRVRKLSRVSMGIHGGDRETQYRLHGSPWWMDTILSVGCIGSVGSPSVGRASMTLCWVQRLSWVARAGGFQDVHAERPCGVARASLSRTSRRP
jgi:hypothetical protein